MTADADVVIVGAGLAGLSAAVHLHRAGVATTVCEAAEDAGGRVRTDYQDGFLLDLDNPLAIHAAPSTAMLFQLRGIIRIKANVPVGTNGLPLWKISTVSGSGQLTLLTGPGDRFRAPSRYQRLPGGMEG